MGKKRIIQKAGEETISQKQEPGTSTIQQKTPPFSSTAQEGRVYVCSSYNNTIMSLTDREGNVLFHASAGMFGFKGTKKSTPYAASKVAQGIFQAAQTRKIEKVHVFMKGIGPGRESALRTLGTKEFDILSIKDITPIPHNGPRQAKVRRI